MSTTRAIPDEVGQMAMSVLRDFQDNERFCAESLVVQNKQGQQMPAVWGPAQRRLFEAVQKQREAGLPVRIIYLKGRQVWVSTGAAMIFFKETAFIDGQRAEVYAHDEDSTQKIFEYYRRFHENYKPFRGVVALPDKLTFSIKEGITYANGSAIQIHTAGNTSGGRSRTTRRLHLSEFAFWPDPKTLMDGLMQSLPDDPDSMCIIESTANGMGNLFHELWKTATDPKQESAWLPVFFAWWEHPEYVLKLSVRPEDFEASLTQEEKDLRARFRLSHEQLNWRRWTIKNKCNNDPRVFQQEHPSDPEEAFLVSGSPKFDTQLIQWQKKYEEEGIVGGLDRIKEPRRELLIFAPRARGELTIFRKPERGGIYAIGADPASGIDVNLGIGSRDPDYSCGNIFHVNTGEQVARLSERLEPGPFGEYLVDLAEWYNFAFIVPEINKDGGATVDRILYLNYPRRFIYHRTENARDGGTVKRAGWSTNTVSRPQLMSKIDTALRERSVILHHKTTVQQFFTFVIWPDGIPRAQKRCHDDDVIAVGLGIVGIQTCPRPEPEEESDSVAHYGESARERYQRNVRG